MKPLSNQLLRWCAYSDLGMPTNGRRVTLPLCLPSCTRTPHIHLFCLLQAFAKRPTNLMLVLSIVDAAKSVFGTAGVRDKRKSSGAPTSHSVDTHVPIAKGAIAVVPGNDPSEPSKGSRTTSIPEARGQETQAGRSSDLNEVRAPFHCAESKLRRQRRRGRRDTSGWRAWEAR